MARKIPYDTSAQALLFPHRAPPFFEDWTAADFDNVDLLAAECSRLAYADHATTRAALGPHGFELTTTLGGETLRERHETGGTEGFITESVERKIAILAFRGTESNKPEDILTDAMTTQVAWPARAEAQVHAGFLDRFERVKATLLPKPQTTTHTVVVTGHSLGAALATLAAAELDTAGLVTFGSPRVGNTAFAQHFANRGVRRYVNCCDIVARVPPTHFTAVELQMLLDGLSAANHFPPTGRTSLRLLNQTLARLVAEHFGGFTPPLEFAHVSPPIPIDEHGTITPDLTEPEFAQRQATARESYPHRLSFAHLSQAVESLLPTGPSNVFRTLLGVLTGTQAFGPVFSRDLADHAMINYISSFTGRLKQAD